jgi:hypothetical protein
LIRQALNRDVGHVEKVRGRGRDLVVLRLSATKLAAHHQQHRLAAIRPDRADQGPQSLFKGGNDFADRDVIACIRPHRGALPPEDRCVHLEL